ncbi:MAG: hypothetical protein C0483_19475 [Pirellula sp.]|nr:hypothetical protein [Pirellula sp.]
MRNRRRGFTLLETMLTLALLVGLTALAWPALEKPFAVERLRKSADQLHADLTRARATAIRNGQTLEFVVDGTSGHYAVMPIAGFAPSQATPAVSAVAPSAGAEHAPGQALPEGIRIVTIEAIDDVTPAPQPVGFAQPADPAAAAASQTVYFHPDGTTSTAVFTLANEHGMALRLELRGLTGTLAKGDPFVFQAGP